MSDLSFALGFVGLLAGALVMWLGMRVRGGFADLERRIAEMDSSLKQLELRLEESARNSAKEQAHRHTHRTIAGLEDATAVLIDAEIEVEALMARLRTVHRILGKTRQGPESYSNKEWEVKE